MQIYDPYQQAQLFTPRLKSKPLDCEGHHGNEARSVISQSQEEESLLHALL
jgi:hypothetical protein